MVRHRPANTVDLARDLSGARFAPLLLLACTAKNLTVSYYPEESNEDYYSYYLNQAGNGFNAFRGSTIQTGQGIGSFLGGLARSAMLLVKSFAGKALKTGLSFARDAMAVEDIGKSAL